MNEHDLVFIRKRDDGGLPLREGRVTAQAYSIPGRFLIVQVRATASPFRSAIYGRRVKAQTYSLLIPPGASESLESPVVAQEAAVAFFITKSIHVRGPLITAQHIGITRFNVRSRKWSRKAFQDGGNRLMVNRLVAASADGQQIYFTAGAGVAPDLPIRYSLYCGDWKTGTARILETLVSTRW